MTLQERLRVQYNLTAMEEFEQAADRIDALEKALRECADDLEAELIARYDGTLNYPVMKRRYDSDMGSVQRARAVLEDNG